MDYWCRDVLTEAVHFGVGTGTGQVTSIRGQDPFACHNKEKRLEDIPGGALWCNGGSQSGMEFIGVVEAQRKGLMGGETVVQALAIGHFVHKLEDPILMLQVSKQAYKVLWSSNSGNCEATAWGFAKN